jgi:hypothetical protein
MLIANKIRKERSLNTSKPILITLGQRSHVHGFSLRVYMDQWDEKMDHSIERVLCQAPLFHHSFRWRTLFLMYIVNEGQRCFFF